MTLVPRPTNANFPPLSASPVEKSAKNGPFLGRILKNAASGGQCGSTSYTHRWMRLIKTHLLPPSLAVYWLMGPRKPQKTSSKKRYLTFCGQRGQKILKVTSETPLQLLSIADLTTPNWPFSIFTPRFGQQLGQSQKFVFHLEATKI